MGGGGEERAGLEWQREEGRVLVSTLRSLFRISATDGIGVGDYGSVRLGGEEVCTLCVLKDDCADKGDAVAGVGFVGDGDASAGRQGMTHAQEEEEEEEEEEDAARVAVDVRVAKRHIGDVTPEMLRQGISRELGLRA